MTTLDQATDMALAMPDAEQKSHFGNVDFRVRNKIFASFPAPELITVHLDPEHARVLIAADPETYVPHAGVWGERGWIRVTLSRIAPDDLADLISESWRRVAPKRIKLDSFP